jgi:hypothetical protein
MKRSVKTSGSVAMVCPWLFENSKKTVTKLKRENGLMVILGDSERLGLKNVRLIVPKGIFVYQCIEKIRNKGEFLFTTRGTARSTNPAYLSVILPDGAGLNYMRNLGILLDYPWYNPRQSSLAFERMSPGANLYLVNLRKGEGPHPLS